jgi:hypothetical protein
VIVRPVILTNGPKTNAYRALVDPRDWTCGFISRADVADFLVKQIDDGAFLHKTPVLTSSIQPSFQFTNLFIALKMPSRAAPQGS